MTIGEDLYSVLTLSSLLCLSPFYKKKSNTFKPCKIYTLIVNLLLLGLCAFSIADSITEKGFIGFLKITISALWTLSLSLTFWLGVKNTKKFQTLFDTFNEIDAKLKKPCRVSKVGLKFAAFHVALFTLFSQDIYYYIQISDYEDYKFLLPFEVEKYYNSIEAALEFFILDSIRARYSVFNLMVENLKVSVMTVEAMGKNGGSKEEILENLIVVHRMICNCVIGFNGFFKWRLFTVILYIFLGLIKNMYYTLVIKSFNLMQLPLVVEIIILAIKMEQILGEQEKAKNSSNELLIKNLSQSHKFSIFFAQTSLVRPGITAGGFFYVNFAMIFMLFNLMATYIIIMIQLLPR